MSDSFLFHACVEVTRRRNDGYDGSAEYELPGLLLSYLLFHIRLKMRTAYFAFKTMIAQHVPLITNRIQFNFHPIAVLPVITARIQFTFDATEFGLEGGAPIEERELTPSDDGSMKMDGNNLSKQDDNDGESELTDLSESESDKEGCVFARSTHKVPKPPGEPGRPNCGGYSLDDELMSWGKEELSKMTVSKIYDGLKVSFNSIIFRNSPGSLQMHS